ncbi:MAG TPA: LexA family transcriptional regulator [Candidatus Alectryocaccomicrobium excrementavium]|uniref:LexA family transcriptional regulator n=1 Tax=Candidatus Alectryocaccomicrobium excrementavium TaxID=2840668 RepID=A0A9D1FZL8_9FIRM|nr:LexA family transcriptional regulator [Candidatus Alectryocaccomicrobium excrementavium]
MERMQALRKQRGLSQAALGEALGVKQNTISQWENGSRQPDAKTLALLADFFGISIDALLGRDAQEWLHPLLDAYLRAPGWARRRVCRLLGIAYLCPAAAPGWVTCAIYRDPAAAGAPLDASPDWDNMDFPAQDVPEGARFGVRILGDSMEPAIHDGQIAWVDDRVELSDGEIGIFRLESGAVCKRLRLGANGRAMRLESINPAYAPITGKALAGLEGVGRVIGTAWPPDAP